MKTKYNNKTKQPLPQTSQTPHPPPQKKKKKIHKKKLYTCLKNEIKKNILIFYKK